MTERDGVSIVVTGSEIPEAADIASGLEGVSGVTVERVQGEERPDGFDAIVAVDAPPESDGLATFERVRDRGDLRPVVLVGVGTEPERVETAIEAGITDYVSWDDDPETLAARLRAHVRFPVLDGTAQARRWETQLSSFAHDLKNPLNVISGRMELLDVDDTHSEAIARSLSRVETMIEEMRTVGSFSGPVREMEPVALATIAQQVWAGLTTSTATLEIETETQLDANRDYLEILLVHLFENAIQHGGEDVTVTVGDTDGGFYVADDGQGLTEDERGNLFDQGFGTARQGEGYGLFVADRVAAAHGWTVTAEASDAGGARFEVRPR